MNDRNRAAWRIAPAAGVLGIVMGVGILNIAGELHGVQLGLINIARNKTSFSMLPLINYHP